MGMGMTPWSFAVKRAAETPLQAHQQRVLRKLQAQPGLLMVHGMGSGKTLSMLAAADALGMPATVIGPAAQRGHFAKEHAKHRVRQPVTYHSYEGAPPPGSKHRLLVFDEAHRMGRLESQKSHLPDTLAAEKTLLGTGTPIRNEPSELIPLLRAVGTDLPRDRQAFLRQFVEEETVHPSWTDRLLRGVRPGTRRRAKNLPAFRKLIRGKVDYYQAGTDGYPGVVEQDIRVKMTPRQEATYQLVMRDAGSLRHKVEQGLPPSKRESKQLNAFLGAARQVSNTPRSYSTHSDPVEDAPKILRAAKEIDRFHAKDPNYRGVTYSNYIESGLAPLSQRLEAKGIPHGLFTGKQTARQRAATLDDYEQGRIRHLLISSAGAEGLDLKGTKLLQILEPHWNDARLAQAEARAVRYQSHDHLPPKEREVVIQRFLSDPSPRRQWLPWNKRPVQGIDEYLRTLSKEKSELNQAFLDVIAKEGR